MTSMVCIDGLRKLQRLCALVVSDVIHVSCCLTTEWDGDQLKEEKA